MAAEDVVFLRNQVERLNVELARYQQKYPQILTADYDETDAPGVPWLSDKSSLSPLLLEYDSCIKLLKEQVQNYKAEQRELRSNLDKLVAENHRLTRQLKDAVEAQLRVLPGPAPADAARDVSQETLATDQALHNLQYQLQIALQEKDSAMEMWQASVQEVERLEREVQGSGFNPRLQALQKQAEQIKGQYVQTVTELNNEVSTLQGELRRSKAEQKVAGVQVAELRNALEEMRLELAKQEQEKTVNVGRAYATDSRMGDLQKRSIETERRLEVAERDYKRAIAEKTNLEDKLLEFQKKSADQEQKAYEASLQVRESVQTVETAMLEKDQALVRERQSQEEVDNLQGAINKLLEEAGSRTRQEVDNVRRQCNQNISRLMDEIQTLELENSEKQAQIDRAIREKRAVESELEKIYQEGLHQGSRDNSAYEDLNRRACNAESTRDQALIKVDSLQGEMTRLQRTLKQERNHLAQEVGQLKERLALTNQKLDAANEDRVKLIETIDDLKKRTQQVTIERDSAQRNMTKELTCLERDMQMKQRESEVKLQSLEDSHRHALMETRQLLASQQRMSAKWKEECQSVTHKLEVRVRELREEAARERQRNAQLTKLLKDSGERTQEAENMLSEYTKNIKRMEDRVRSAEERAANPSLQHSRPDRDIVEERRILKRNLERSLRESKPDVG